MNSDVLSQEIREKSLKGGVLHTVTCCKIKANKKKNEEINGRRYDNISIHFYR